MLSWTLAALAVAAAPVTVAAAPVADCPLRDAAFSLDSPLIDVLLSPSAKAAADQAMSGKLSSLPPFFARTDAPTFSAILTLRQVAMMVGADAKALPALDTKLRSLPVTEADHIARCARYDNDRPQFDLQPGKPHILLFEKINGFKDEPGFNAAHAAFIAMAARKGWNIVTTNRGGAFTPENLSHFDAVVWNNISGDVLTLAQRKAFRDYIEKGGAYIGVHGSAGDPSYFWDWYADTLLGARFVGHPMQPQFQEARIFVDDKTHPAAARLPATWTMKDEWYSFAASPRLTGADVIARLDESTYSQNGGFGEKLSMGDHPIAWSRHVGKGRMFYSAIGHLPQSYSEAHYVAMLEDAADWAIGKSASPTTAHE
ncbi:hypothetical protein EDF56_102366 [Novosphingobium sp. PhB165]|uniref:ThuA domain-containing protein n=1 Tax=Novosphingobium sp. PhB165 TaxID=2485105 RepID=UPI001043408A|nr:ThuA domain-containing protein [Novosphingobium sp. PhB165]TCM20703.1 hypothetical protein EDF56_102366 [Novosphingobium sp. PhB165]